jgi:dTDP-4-dehydrorhamnose reductase
MRLLVTGAAGMLGRDVVAAAGDAGHEVAALARADLDIADADAVNAAVTDLRPGAVVNCAAWTDVDGAESAEGEATVINGAGAGHVAAAAFAAGALVVHMSSDYVFDGTAREPYREAAPPSPQSAYGRSKRAGEIAVAGAAPDRCAIVRAGWLFGPHGRNFVDTMRRLGGERDEVAVVDDQVGSPTYTGHLAPALVRIAERGLTGVMHVAGGGRCSWHELAAATFADAAIACRVRPQSTADLGRPAPRPAFSALASTRADVPVLPPWRDGLRAHLARATPINAPGSRRSGAVA